MKIQKISDNSAAFDEESFISDPNQDEDPSSNLLIQALLDDGYSRGDIEIRFGLLSQP